MIRWPVICISQVCRYSSRKPPTSTLQYAAASIGSPAMSRWAM